MKDAFLFLLLAAAAYLIYDDYSKRDALNQMQTQVQSATSIQRQLIAQRDQAIIERNQALQNPTTIYVKPSQTPLPDWFQQHLNKGSSLDTSQRHDRP